MDKQSTKKEERWTAAETLVKEGTRMNTHLRLDEVTDQRKTSMIFKFKQNLNACF